MQLLVNQQLRDIPYAQVDPGMPLLWVLRDVLQMTGTKFGCGAAACGACTVLVDGQAARSCVMPLSSAVGRAVQTIEGLGSPERPHALQRAWIEHQVPQCGYCQSGMLMAAAALLARIPDPSDADIDNAMAHPLADDFFTRLDALNAAGQGLDHPGLAYAYAKRALKQYVADHATAWGKEGKRLVSISPGLIDTEMGRLESDAMENFDAMRSLVALQRLGAPEDIAHTALFLVSAKAAYITGCDILVDGGFIAGMNRQQRSRTP